MGGFLGEGEMNCASWILTTVSFLEGKLGRGFEYFFNFHPILGVNDPIWSNLPSFFILGCNHQPFKWWFFEAPKTRKNPTTIWNAELSDAGVIIKSGFPIWGIHLGGLVHSAEEWPWKNVFDLNSVRRIQQILDSV